MQRPTCKNMRVRNVHDAQVILHAVHKGILPMVRRRLDDDERQALSPGDIYVWEERGNNPMEAPSLESIQRFTDGRSWGPSKARDEFLMYYEKDVNPRSSLMTRNNGLQSMRLIKQTYSAYVDGPTNSRKWHLNAYYTQDSVDTFGTIDDVDQLRSLHVPPGRYSCARACNGRKGVRSTTQPSQAQEETPGVQLRPTSYVHTSGSPVPSYYEKHPSLTKPRYAEVRVAVDLAPLEYLESIPPSSRDPSDEKLLRSFHHDRRF